MRDRAPRQRLPSVRMVSVSGDQGVWERTGAPVKYSTLVKALTTLTGLFFWRIGMFQYICPICQQTLPSTSSGTITQMAHEAAQMALEHLATHVVWDAMPNGGMTLKPRLMCM